MKTRAGGGFAEITTTTAEHAAAKYGMNMFYRADTPLMGFGEQPWEVVLVSEKCSRYRNMREARGREALGSIMCQSERHAGQLKSSEIWSGLRRIAKATFLSRKYDVLGRC